MTKFKSLIKKSISLILCASLLSTSLLFNVYATDSIGIYQYTSSEGSNKQNEDVFIYHDECFERSSYKGCGHLIALSAQAAIASFARYGEGEDKYDRDPSNTAQNIKAMLTTMGFENVESNEWSYHEPEENSIGVTVGQRTITANGQDYTLLAIMPRSAGYRQEWAGNMNVGPDKKHDGFLAARDEALRFTKKYINNHNITGPIKVWIAGHSRGGATANLLAGFFAGGGIGYFGDAVTITPEDVYCYTFEPPRPIINGVSNDEILSVSANRNEAGYQYDTPGGAYEYTQGGTVNTQDEIYNGIRNFPFNYDLVTHVAFERWGYGYYGAICNFEDISEEQMLDELKAFDENVYNKYVDGGSPDGFHEKKFDVASLSIVDVEDSEMVGQLGMENFIDERMGHLVENFDTPERFYTEYQDTLMAAAGLVALLLPIIGEMDNIASYVVQPILFSYLDYSSKKLMSEGKVDNEWDGSALVIEQLLEYATGKEIDPSTFKVDDFIKMLGEFVRDNKDKEAVNQVKEMITKAVPEKYQSIAKSYLGNFYPGSKDTPGFNPSDIPMGDIAIPYLIACAEGADPTSVAYNTTELRTPEGVRANLYTLVNVMTWLVGGDMQKIKDAINGGNGSFKGFVKAFLEVMMNNTPDNNGATQYTTLAEAANGEFYRALDLIERDAFEIINDKGIFNQAYKDRITKNIDTIQYHIALLRELLIDLLFGNDGEYNLEYNIRNISTLAGNISRFPLAHYDEPCIAYGKASINYGDEPVVFVAPIARSLMNFGVAQELVDAGFMDYGNVYYALSDNPFAEPADEAYSTDIPTGTETGTYYVWYKGVGDLHHQDVDPQCLTVIITDADRDTSGLIPNDYGTKVKDVPKTNTL